MLFKVDENLPVEIAQLLSDLGHDAKTINDQRLQGVNDRVLLERCDNEKRALVTLLLFFHPPSQAKGVTVVPRPSVLYSSLVLSERSSLSSPSAFFRLLFQSAIPNPHYLVRFYSAIRNPHSAILKVPQVNPFSAVMKKKLYDIR